MRVRPTWKVPTAKQAANFVSDFDRPSFGTLRRLEAGCIAPPTAEPPSVRQQIRRFLSVLPQRQASFPAWAFVIWPA